MRTIGDPDFCQHRDMVELPESGEPAAEAGDSEDVGRDQEVAELRSRGPPMRVLRNCWDTP
jgi:hypothetical protein